MTPFSQSVENKPQESGSAATYDGGDKAVKNRAHENPQFQCKTSLVPGRSRHRQGCLPGDLRPPDNRLLFFMGSFFRFSLHRERKKGWWQNGRGRVREGRKQEKQKRWKHPKPSRLPSPELSTPEVNG